MHHAVVGGGKNTEGIGIKGKNGGTDEDQSNGQTPTACLMRVVTHSNVVPIDTLSPSLFGNLAHSNRNVN